jgi:hypothetical protein
MSLFHKLYTGFTFGMTAYGFSRGYRCEEYKNRFYTDKIFAGVVNSTMYTAPGINLFPLYRLVNRIEIDYKKKDKHAYYENYIELVGKCHDTY